MFEYKSIAYRILTLGLGLALLLSACAQATTTQGAMTEEPAQAMSEKPTQAMSDEPTQAMSGEPAQAMASETPPAAETGNESMAGP